MSRTTKRTLPLARAALDAGKQALPEYSHPKSPHKYTQPQLFALLVLKQLFKLDYRGIVALVAEWAELREVLELQGVPHYSTTAGPSRTTWSTRRRGTSSSG